MPTDTPPMHPVAPLAPTQVPIPARLLTAFGALPFVALTLAAWIGFQPFGRSPLDVLSLYALTILSFMGAIHWGLAMSRPTENEAWTYIGSTAPGLLGWFAVAFFPGPVALRIMAAAFVVVLLYDLRATRYAHAPAWYPRLRIPVTIIVASALTLASLVH